MSQPSRTFFLHAGPPKTGTTTIQRFFRDNAGVFRAQDFFRPQTGTELRSHYHLDLVEAFASDRPDHPLKAKLAAEIEEASRPFRVFISAEHFAVRLSEPAYLESLTRFCTAQGYRLHVIAYLRPPAPLLNSLYTQAVKSWRPIVSIDGFLDREVQSARHDYLTHFANLAAHKEASLTLRPFSKAVLKLGLTNDLCAVMGLDTGETVLAAAEEEANASPGPMTVSAFERIRKRVTKEHPGLNRDILAPLTWPLLRAAGALGWNDVKYGGITPERAAMVQARFSANNDALAHRFWGKPWNDVFTEAEQLPPPYNIFLPAKASPQQRRAYREFIDSAMEMVGELVGA